MKLFSISGCARTKTLASNSIFIRHLVESGL